MENSKLFVFYFDGFPNYRHSDLTKYQEYCENEVLHFVWYDDGDPRVKNLQSNMIFDAGSRIHGEKDN